MEIKDLKPDLDRVTYALYYYKRMNEASPEYPKNDWDKIMMGKLDYDIKEKEDLKILIEGNSLKAYYNDLLFIAFQFFKKEKEFKEMMDFAKANYEITDELRNALKFLIQVHPDAIRIEIKHKEIKLSTSISSRSLIHVIRKALVNEFIENDNFINLGYINLNPYELTELDAYIDFLQANEKVMKKKQGRKRSHFLTGWHIDALQTYLQEFTEIKADYGIPISRGQASFIYKFLKTVDLIPDEYAWQEDNIRHILNKFRERRIQRKSFKEVMEESAIHMKDIKSKLKNFNKNKLP